jgi:carbon starvation protein CstA
VQAVSGQSATAVTSSALVFPYLVVAVACGAIAWFATRIPRGTS